MADIIIFPGQRSAPPVRPHENEPRRCFNLHEVASDYMVPTFQSGDLVAIDESITYIHADGVYLLGFPFGEPALRRVQVLFGSDRVRVYCDRDAGTPYVEECDRRELRVLGRAVRALSARNL